MGKLAPHRNLIVQRLNAAGIGTSVYYPHPVPRLAYYRQKYGTPEKDYVHAAKISDQSIALPIGPHVSAFDLEKISNELKKAIREIDL
jgi:dTDP-4-amino-4,6-dideoxygalactose transaminase